MKFTVNKMARIENSTINIKPLTVFVGKNGTNKSYMAHLVYELYKEIKKLDNEMFYDESKIARNIRTKFLKDNKDKLQNLDSAIISSEEHEIKHQVDVDEYEIETVTIYKYSIEKLNDSNNLLECIYNHIIDSLVNRINKSYNTKLQIIDEINFGYSISEIFSISEIEIKASEKGFAHSKLIQKLFSIVNIFLNKNVDTKEFFYFPSSRTGFILAFDEIVSGVFRDRFGGQPTGTKLTIPTTDFLSNFADIKTGKFQESHNLYDPFRTNQEEKNTISNDVIQYLEKFILKGEILESKNEEDYTHYSLKTNTDDILDLHLSSTATLELLPLIVFLKYFKTLKDKLLVIEEPEAHLHPKAQIIMARFLVMLVNNGAKVLVTTHSDYMIKEFNACINLKNGKQGIIDTYNLDDGMGEKIHLNEDDLAVYLFKDNIDNVDVIPLEIDDEDGIPIDSFNSMEEELATA
jgi:predicted ATPase